MLKKNENMKKTINIIIGFCLLLAQTSFGQIKNPSFSKREVTSCDILEIERTPYYTTVFFKYTAPSTYVNGGWVCAGGDFFIRDTYTNTKYKLIKATYIPICPAHHNFQHNEQFLEFNIVFEPLPNSTLKIDIIEDEIKGGFNFFGVELKTNNTFSEETKILKSDGKFRETDSPISDIITIIPAGTSVKTLSSLSSGYYKADYIGQIGYLNELYFQSSEVGKNTSQQSNNSNNEISSSIKNWNENNLKNYWKKNGADEIEGIYIRSREFINCNGYGNCKTENFVSNDFYIVKMSDNYILGSFNDEKKSKIEKIYGVNKFFLTADNYCMNDGIKTFGFYLTNSNELIFEQIVYNSSADVEGYTINYKLTVNDKYSPIFKPEKRQEIRQGIEQKQKSSGTGYAISSNGYIVTNHHVTNGATSIKIRGINGDFSKTFTAKIIIEDKNNDLSIIKIDDSNFTTLGTIPYVIANRTSDVGSSVFVLGYPLRATMGDEVKLTNGIISSKSGFQGDVTSYQVTAPIQPGNSGGPLFDEKGSIIGIINAKHVGAENASYAIKASYLMNLIDLMPNTPKLQTVSTVAGKSLTEQVKILKKYTYIIEINQ